MENSARPTFVESSEEEVPANINDSSKSAVGPQKPSHLKTDENETLSDCGNQTEDNLVSNPNKADDQTMEEKEEEWQDILGSGQLLKKVLKKGHSDTRPQRLDVCTIKYVGKYEDKVVDEGHATINIGDAEIIQGLDLAISLMDLEEEAEIIVGPRFAFGSVGREPDIPPDATLHYTVVLVDSDPEPLLETLSLEERKDIGNRKKDRGNYWYSRKDHTLAIQCYRRALEYLDDNGVASVASSNPVNDEEIRALLEDRIKVYNNLAAAQIKIKALDSALQSVDNVLTCQPDNVKALFRKGKILGEKGDTEEGISFLRKSLALDPENVQAKNELIQLMAKQKKDIDQQKQLYKKMLGTNKPTANKVSSPSAEFRKWGVVAGCVGALFSMLVAYKWFKPV